MNQPIHISSSDSPKDINKKVKAIAQKTLGRKINCYQVLYDKGKQTVSIPLEPNYLLIVRHVAECTIEIDHGYYELTPAMGILINQRQRTIDTGAAQEYDEHVNTGVTVRFDELDIELRIL
jgi:hypothetical protein